MASVQSIPRVLSTSSLHAAVSAPGRSILLSTGMMVSCWLSARYALAIVCASTPWLASTTSSAPSHAASERDTSYLPHRGLRDRSPQRGKRRGARRRVSVPAAPQPQVAVRRVRLRLMVAADDASACGR
eukprot:4221159-Prymnesium_polylepis.1